jgi:hypothetical protein
MRLVAAVSHTPWIPERVASMERLREMLDVSVVGGEPCCVHTNSYFEMTDRAHVSVWSGRMWQQAYEQLDGEGHAVFLQDDDRVPSGGLFWSALRAILAVVSDELIGLHLHHPGAVAARRAGERFVTTTSCVGVGYALPAALLADFLQWRAELPADLVYRTSEDNLLDAWAIARRRRVWHPVPTIVRPDRALGSTGGGAGRDDADDQYMRDCVLDWRVLHPRTLMDAARLHPRNLMDSAWWRAGLRLPPRHLVFAGIARPGVSMTAMPAGFDGQARMGRS